LFEVEIDGLGSVRGRCRGRWFQLVRAGSYGARNHECYTVSKPFAGAAISAPAKGFTVSERAGPTPGAT